MKTGARRGKPSIRATKTAYKKMLAGKLRPPAAVRGKGGRVFVAHKKSDVLFKFEPDLDNQYPGQPDSDGDRKAPRKKKK